MKDDHENEIHSIFFDDKAYNDEDCIVDTWSIFSNQRIAPKDAINKFIYKVKII